MTIEAIDQFIAEQGIDTQKPGWKKDLPRPWQNDLPKPPQAAFDDGKTIHWLLETTAGPIKIRLMPEVAPKHVASTVYLTKLGFYDGLLFHRIIPGFMAQGGCPDGSGMGGPGYQYDSECSPAVRHDRPGLLSMANTGRPCTDGSQFFLTFVPTPHLDGKHTIFGEVVEGMDVVSALENQGSASGKSAASPRIEKASITAE